MGVVPIGELMELVPLRARATCTSCLSKLPPRTEVYWDRAAQKATCLTCMHLLLEEEAAPQEPVEIDIDAPPAWGQVLAGQDNLPTEAPAVETVLAEPDEADSGRDHAVVEDEVEETTAPAASAEPEPAPAADSEPDGALAAGSEPPGTDPPSVGDLLGSPTPTPFRGVPVSHGLTIRRGSRPVGSREEPEPAETELDRGDMGEGRVGQTLEAARIHGLEVLHGFDVASGVQPIDHLVIAVNGLWVIRAQDVLTGRLERRDLGDWFSADPRLYVKDEDATHLIDETRRQVEALRARLGPTSFGDMVVRGVVCFGTAPAGWVSDPFDIANIRVTWRNLLVEPMLDPVMLDEDSRLRLTAMLATDRQRAKTA